ncbi:hypothetical protein DLH72_00355 [Candidatus Gracilibacteria bacterium]|nr:MAG: hypothetical protein DLH72_00355 [Candidatus Gracilibacteria bacterium]
MAPLKCAIFGARSSPAVIFCVGVRVVPFTFARIAFKAAFKFASGMFTTYPSGAVSGSCGLRADV